MDADFCEPDGEYGTIWFKAVATGGAVVVTGVISGQIAVENQQPLGNIAAGGLINVAAEGWCLVGRRIKTVLGAPLGAVLNWGSPNSVLAFKVLKGRTGLGQPQFSTTPGLL